MNRWMIACGQARRARAAVNAFPLRTLHDEEFNNPIRGHSTMRNVRA